MGLTDFSDTGRERLKLMTLEYTNVSEGNFVDEPVIELFCRNAAGERRRVNVHNYYPHFYISEREFIENKDDLLKERAIRYIEVDERLLSEEEKLNGSLEPVASPPRQTLQGTDLVRIYTVVPRDVGDLREQFDQHWEADVFFTNRYLIDSDVKLGLSVPSGATDVSFDEIEVLDSGEEPDINPRMLTVDIEVWSGGTFPDTQNPEKPITAITAHDTYDDEYFVGVLHPDAVQQGQGHTWDDNLSWEAPDGLSDDELTVNVYHQEGELLSDFNSFVVEKDPDLLTGWNSSRNDIGSGFDYPYIINRCDLLNEWTIQDLAYDNGGAYVTNRGTPNIGGREMFDMLQAYKKTQIHEKRSYALGYIANEELGYGKEDIESLDDGWLHNPVEFIRYNIRDTQAVVEIEKSKNVLEMYDHIRSITGATYSEIADSNIGIIDLLFLRSAKEKGYALPTSERPDVQYYWGAYVFDPVPGKHRNVVYPDLSSLYPNLFRDMNASPETIIGDEDALKASEYSKDQCHTIYVDQRHEDVKDAADEPVRSKLYVLKPDVKESFVREIVQDLIDMKYEYKKPEYGAEAYSAVKRITNSVYGVMGDSISYGKGFRLFDWRIAEAITLAGRDVIKHTADVFEDRVQSQGYRDAKIVSGDSVPAEEPTVIKRDGTISVTEIKDVQVGDKVWSDDGFTTVKNVIKKPNRKQCYTTRSQTGVVHTTSDHGLLRPDGTEVTPEELTEGEQLLHNDVANIDLPESNSVSDEEAWLLGVFCAEGSAGIYETSSEYDDYKAQVKISNQETELLTRAGEYFSCCYGFSTKLHDDTGSSNVHNLKPHGNAKYDISKMIARLRKWCYTDSGEKKVPDKIFSAPKSAKKSFLNGFHAGDGHIKEGNYKSLKEYDEMWSKSAVLLQGIVVLLRNVDIAVSLSWRNNYDTQYYRVRCPNFRKVDETECREIESYEYTGEYVYDLETENHHFAAGIGSMIVHNTDSCVCEVPSADGMEETLEAAHEAAEYVDMTYDEFMAEKFNMDSNNMAVEIESYAESALFMDKKKRYAQWIRWDEGDAVDEVEYKGFELVRSDSAATTGKIQKGVIDRILKEDSPKSAVSSYLEAEWDKLVNGSVELDDLGIPSAINNKLMDYGWSIQTVDKSDEPPVEIGGELLEKGDEYVKYFTAQPHIRGARYASCYIDGEDISQGSKPLMFYVDGITPTGELPETYDYDDKLSLNAPEDLPDANKREMKEIGREVDALAVEDVRSLPDDVKIDYEKMANKTVRKPVEPIVEVMNWSFDDLVTEGEQTGLAQYM